MRSEPLDCACGSQATAGHGSADRCWIPQLVQGLRGPPGTSRLCVSRGLARETGGDFARLSRSVLGASLKTCCARSCMPLHWALAGGACMRGPSRWATWSCDRTERGKGRSCPGRGLPSILRVPESAGPPSLAEVRQGVRAEGNHALEAPAHSPPPPSPAPLVPSCSPLSSSPPSCACRRYCVSRGLHSPPWRVPCALFDGFTFVTDCGHSRPDPGLAVVPPLRKTTTCVGRRVGLCQVALGMRVATLSASS